MSERHDEHYINSIAALGDAHAVTTTQAVFTRNGIKLIDQGARINSALREKLMQHTLTPAIDDCLAVANGVTPASLRDRARELLDSEPRFQPIREALGGVDRLLNAFYAMPLNPPLAFKLTVAREQRPEVFEHSVQMTLIALFLAVRHGLPDRALATVAAAGMFHDLGELHIDPALLHPDHRLGADELRHIYAHPMTTYLILQGYPQFHPEVSTAVFEHHERLDGSGYPRGLRGEAIGEIGQILMLAEAVTTLFEKSWRTHGAARLTLMLKMNRRKFNPVLVGHLVSLLQGSRTEQPDGADASAVASATAQLNQLAEVFRSWRAAHPPGATESPLLSFVDQRLGDLERTLLETGFHPDEVAALTAGIEHDAAALDEIQLMARESRKQASDIVNEVRRRWAALPANDAGRATVEAWIKQAEALLQP